MLNLFSTEIICFCVPILWETSSCFAYSVTVLQKNKPGEYIAIMTGVYWVCCWVYKFYFLQKFKTYLHYIQSQYLKEDEFSTPTCLPCIMYQYSSND